MLTHNNIKIAFKETAPYLLAFFLGSGLLKICIALGLIVIFQFRKSFNFRDGNFYQLVFIYLFFIFTYYIFYVPYKSNNFHIENNYFFNILILSAFALLIPKITSKSQHLILLVQAFCLGAFAVAGVTVIATILLKPPPYYGQIIDIRALARGLIQYGNSPGIANLLAFYGITFQATLLLSPATRKNVLWQMGFLCLTFSILAATLLEQRTFFILVLIIQPIIVSTFLLLINFSYKRLLIPALILSIYPFVLGIEKIFNIVLIKRTLNYGLGLLSDPRVSMNKFWLEGFLQDPFKPIEVGPPEWSHLPWFHNFFADVHRISGFWALLAAIILVSYIFIRLIALFRVNKKFGGFLLAVAIPTFLIMMTSVVPEGEKQPFILMLLIGSVCERFAYLQRSKPFAL